ncbi:MAG: 3-isopropylmalate dehydratase small subunit [Bordetella sp.]|nr:MAG: 3-isopropylmalate dehydratase small subunit [Bordetella sp.]
MQKFTIHKGLVAPMDRENVDTDLIIPKQFLKSIKRTGFGENLFDELRYLNQGSVGMKNSNRPLNPDFVLNQKKYQGSSILLARRNFGCGSSREHALWALTQYGFRAIIAPSYADIFFNNSFKNGLLPIYISEKIVDQLFKDVEKFLTYYLEINLEKQIIITPDNWKIAFDIDAFRKDCLINGFDDIDLTLKHSSKINSFEFQHFHRYPWLKDELS